MKETVIRSLAGVPLTLVCGGNKVFMETVKGSTYRFDKDLKWTE
jgi:hypothetical protein